jgi:hypothetical protein
MKKQKRQHRKNPALVFGLVFFGFLFVLNYSAESGNLEQAKREVDIAEARQMESLKKFEASWNAKVDSFDAKFEAWFAQHYGQEAKK